jgi:hypothetical protein
MEALHEHNCARAREDVSTDFLESPGASEACGTPMGSLKNMLTID